MCGIVGGLSRRNVCPILLEGLKHLEYRGYDSAGIAVVTENHQLMRQRVVGKVDELNDVLHEHAITGKCGIAHTRWATHGIPSVENAHPHISHNSIAIAHNGIIENHQSLREKLLELGYQFTSTTDSEVIVHLIHHYYQTSKDLLSSVQKTLKDLRGMYAIAVIAISDPDTVITARHGSPLVLGLGEQENYLASDSLALQNVTDHFIYLEDGDLAILKKDEVRILNSHGQRVKREVHTVKFTVERVDRSHFSHYMQKEIQDQPQSLRHLLEGRLNKKQITASSFGEDAESILAQTESVTLVACGTSYYAAMVGRYWLEELAGIPTQVETASEYRYRHPVIKPKTLFVVLSQSGETADTLAAFRLAKKQGYLATLVICNVAESTLVREAELKLLTKAGTEVCVASTKAFIAQLVALLMLTGILGRDTKMTAKDEAHLVHALENLPSHVEKVLALEDQVREIAKQIAYKDHVLFLGRASLYPIALEGALKLKEITYIHAEGFPAGELKHGPLALVDENMPIIVLAPSQHLFAKTKSNVEEIRARGGETFVLTDNAQELQEEVGTTVIAMPAVDLQIAPIIYVVPLQLLAYHVGVIRGNDIDQPRHLAKSVTVE